MKIWKVKPNEQWPDPPAGDVIQFMDAKGVTIGWILITPGKAGPDVRQTQWKHCNSRENAIELGKALAV